MKNSDSESNSKSINPNSEHIPRINQKTLKHISSFLDVVTPSTGAEVAQPFGTENICVFD